MPRRDLLEIYRAGIAAVDGRLRVATALREDSGPAGPLRVIAVGKAAPAMALGAADVLGPRIVAGLVVARRGGALPAVDRLSGWRQLESSHPVPDETSLAAGAAVCEHLAAGTARDGWLVLLSGGSSSLVEVLRPGVDLALLRRANDWLLGSGLPIAAVNAVRRRLSAIKGGGLAARLTGRECLALYISDVPGDDVRDIGSGLLAAAAPAPLPAGLPGWLRACTGAVGPAPAGAVPIRHRVVASLDDALAACAAAARRRGSHVERAPARLDLDVGAAADLIVERLTTGPPGIYLWGGETTVRLPPAPGRGGRNQQLALACAVRLAGRDDVAVLCGATDGSDGPGEDAGGLVDGGTVARGEAAGLEAAAALARADAGPFLAAAGDLVSTGPTSTNVNDLVIGVRVASG